MSSRDSRFSTVVMSSNQRDWRSSITEYSPAGFSAPAHS